MNKCIIIFAVIAFAACVAAAPGYGVNSHYGVGAPLLAHRLTAVRPSAAAASAAASSAASAPNAGYVSHVPSYSILGGHPGYGLGYGLGNLGYAGVPY